MANAGPQRRVLVVDDEKDVQEFITLVLEDTGFAVECAGDGEEAMSMIEISRYDLVILDLMMPKLDGWGVLERLRKFPQPPAVVILSAYSDDWRALRAGAWESLSKPFLPGDLVDTCRRALEH